MSHGGSVYAVVKAGGKQYRVQEGRAITLDRLPGEPGDTIELGEVMLMADGDDVTVGAPLIDGARVVGRIVEQRRGDKIVVFRYKAKTRSRKKTGHRQLLTRVLVTDVLAAGQQPKPSKEETPPAVAEEPAEEQPARGRRRGRKTAPNAAIAEATVGAEMVASAEEEVAEATDEPATEPPAEAAEAPPAEDKPKRRLRRKTE